VCKLLCIIFHNMTDWTRSTIHHLFRYFFNIYVENKRSSIFCVNNENSIPNLLQLFNHNTMGSNGFTRGLPKSYCPPKHGYNVDTDMLGFF
jgi:hypothetical protein